MFVTPGAAAETGDGEGDDNCFCGCLRAAGGTSTAGLRGFEEAKGIDCCTEVTGDDGATGLAFALAVGAAGASLAEGSCLEVIGAFVPL